MGISTYNVTKIYGNKKDIYACKGISLSFEQKGLYFILGRSGSGKSTLLNLLAGIDTPSSGEILVDGDIISNYSTEEMTTYRNLKVGIVFQKINLINSISVADNLRIVLDIQNRNENDRDSQINKVLDEVNLSGFAGRMPSTLSGGEQQRVAIARCLLKGPKYLLADEPTGSLDGSNAKEVFDVLKKISKNHVVIVVSHDKASAYRYADFIIHMEGGGISSTENISSKEDALCSVDITCGLKKEEYRYKSISVILDIIKKKVLQKEDFLVHNIVEGTGREESFDIKEEESDECEIKEQELTIRQCMNLSRSIARKRKMVLSAIPLTIMFILLFAGLYLVSFNQKKTLIGYFEDKGISVIKPYVENSYVNKLDETIIRTLTKGESLLTQLQNGTSNLLCERLRKEVNIACPTEGEPPNWVEVTALYEATKGIQTMNLEDGEYPSYGEVLITDIVARMLSVGVCETIVVENREYTVSGIIDTGIDYLEFKQIQFRINQPYYMFDKETKYCIIVFCEEELQSIGRERDYLELECSDFTKIGLEEGYFQSRLTYSANDSDVITDETGDIEKVYVAESLLPDAEEMADNQFGFVDLSDDRFNHTYDDLLNLFTFFPNGISIEEVLIGESNQGDVLISSKMFDEIRQAYYEFYYADWFIDGTRLTKKEFGELLDTGIKIDEPAAERIYTFADSVEELKSVLWILVILSSVTVITSVLYLAYNSIKRNEINIGILCALGVPRRSVVKIFCIEMIGLTSAVSLMFVVSSYFVRNIMNHIYLNHFPGFSFELLYSNPFLCILMIIALLILGYVSVRLSIKKMMSMNPIDVLKEE